MRSNSYDMFVSYSHRDREFVQQFAHLLDAHRVRVWFDAWEMQPGDILRERIADGIESADYFLVILSPDSLESNWVKHELNSSMIDEIQQGQVRVIPALAPGVELAMLPADLRAKHCLDLRSAESRSAALQQIARLVNPVDFEPILPPPDISKQETDWQRIIARGRPDSAPEAAQQLARSLLGRGDQRKAKLAFHRAVDFERSRVEVAAARELARLLAEDRAYRQAAEICLLAGVNQPLGIAGVDYYLTELQRAPQPCIRRFFRMSPSEYFFEQVRLIERFRAVEREGGYFAGREIEGQMIPIQELVDPAFGSLYPRQDDEMEQRRLQLRSRIVGGDPDAAPGAAYRFGKLLENEQQHFQAECAFEWARNTQHPTVYPIASHRLASKYVDAPFTRRRYFQTAICLGDAELARAAARELAGLLDQADDLESAQFLRQEWDQA